MNSYRCAFAFLFFTCSIFHHNVHSWPTLDKNSAFIAGGIGLGCGIFGTYFYMKKQHANYLNNTATERGQAERKRQQVDTGQRALDEAMESHRKASEASRKELETQRRQFGDSRRLFDDERKKVEAENRSIRATFDQHVSGAQKGSLLQRLFLGMKLRAPQNGKAPDSISSLDVANNLMDIAANNISIAAHDDSGNIQLQRAGLAEG